jgi:hypothetical protein
MVVTWDGRHTMPCCQGFTLEIDGGPVVAGAEAPMTTVQKAWLSPNFDRLRKAHRDRTWDSKTNGEPICQSCAVTKKPPDRVSEGRRVHLGCCRAEAGRLEAQEPIHSAGLEDPVHDGTAASNEREPRPGGGEDPPPRSRR